MRNAVTVLLFLINLSLAFAGYSLRDADRNFRLGNYIMALKQYKALVYKHNNYDVNYNLAVCYLKTNENKAGAIPHLEFCLKENPQSADVHYLMALGYFYQEEFDTAETILNRPIIKADELVLEKAQRQLKIIGNARKFMSAPLSLKFVNLGRRVNTKHAELMPFITDKNSQIYFTSNRRFIAPIQVYAQNIYVSKRRIFGQFGSVKKPAGGLNTEFDEVITDLSYDGKRLITFHNENGKSDLAYSIIENERFIDRQDFKGVNSKDNEYGACYSLNCDTLYFTSDRPGGFGGLDLYYSILLPDDSWGIPINMGETINTPFDENFPKISKDGKTLYFASQGHNTMGGYDIFYSARNGVNWGKPSNIGYPLNDLYDNYAVSFTSNPRYAYVSAVREDGFGDRDLYKVIFDKNPAGMMIYSGKAMLSKNDSVMGIQGLSTKIMMTIFDEEDEIFGSYTVNIKTSKYVIALPPGIYTLVVEGDGIKEYREKIETPDDLLINQFQNKTILLEEAPIN